MALTLDDRASIGDLFARYMWAIDTGDVETLVACFAEDGALESPAVGRYEGRDKIRDFARRFARFRENGAQLRHMISNLLVEGDGETATARCYLAVFITENANSRLLGPGCYDCSLRKAAGEWLLVRRTVTMDHDYELKGI